jgi:hypothetical protein
LLTGNLLIETGIRQKGHPITLQAESDMAWVTRGVVDQLYEWPNVAAVVLPCHLTTRATSSCVGAVSLFHAHRAVHVTCPKLYLSSAINGLIGKISKRFLLVLNVPVAESRVIRLAGKRISKKFFCRQTGQRREIVLRRAHHRRSAAGIDLVA